MSDPGQDHMEDIIKEEKEKEIANEVDDGAMETWVDENREDLVNDFMRYNVKEFNDFCHSLIDQFIDKNECDFNDFCKNRWNEQNE